MGQKQIKITLEDCGQDFTILYINEDGIVIDALPFQANVWRGAIIPVNSLCLFEVGQPLPIHHPPYIIYGFLKYRIAEIEYINE